MSSDTPTKPTLTHSEASLIEVQAAQQARAQAGHAGALPDTREALVADSVGGLKIGGTTIRPLTIGGLWAIEACESQMTALLDESQWGHAAALAYALSHPKDCLKHCLEDNINTLAAEIAALAHTLTPAVVREIEAYYTQQMAALQEDRDEPGKSPTPPRAFDPSAAIPSAGLSAS